MFRADDEITAFLTPQWPGVAEIFRKISDEDIKNLLNRSLDFPHGEFHRKQVSVYSAWIAREFGLSDAQIKTCLYGGFFHDAGRLLVEQKDSESEKHGVASLLAVFLTTNDLFALGTSSVRSLSEAISFHSENVLPDNAALTTRIVRDCDRVAGMGWSGIIRSAYYLGFRHPSFTKRSQEEVAEDNSICDMGRPWGDGYEANVREFVLGNVLPYIREKGKISEMLYHCLIWAGRFDGMKNKHNNSWIVEPVLFEIVGHFLKRHLATVEFVGLLLKETPSVQVKDILKRVEGEYRGFSAKGWVEELEHLLEGARERKMLWD